MSAAPAATPCHVEQSLPVAGIALTAPAVFDGGLHGDEPDPMPSNVTITNPAGFVIASNSYFRVSDDWSTVTPGPIVELTETFCR